MKRSLPNGLRCVDCGATTWSLDVNEENALEVIAGTLCCVQCGRRYRIDQGGILTTLNINDESLQKEIQGWHELAGDLGDHLITTMVALPYYPHGEWPFSAADFFQVFEEVDFADKRVIDIGAGRTWSSRFICGLGRAREVAAVDVLTRRYIGLATSDLFFKEDLIFFERICGDIHRMPFTDGWADIVFGAASIHHSGDLLGLFREVARVLRPGGTFVFVSEPSKSALVPEHQPQNDETAHGINEHIYSMAEYQVALRAAGFRWRRLVPRSIRYRLIYPDAPFQQNIPLWLRRLVGSVRGVNAICWMLRRRWLGSLLYRYCNLPLSVVATKES